MLNAQYSEPFVLEWEIEEGTTIDDVLTALASSESDFRKVVFNPDIGKVSGQVLVVLNDSLLSPTGVSETKLKDGDSLFLIPLSFGG
jgi:molybdopterin converting factor small subunit